ncbi:hypothetical protein [Virgisporangium aurantiacum]|uniref:hypothetical protein n=1 Tax=Virgisporangium aurantiacum TaxID=175570 RepID=UPI00194E417E|nr:hypothetical protein [Virgisporangium aurantiacum]
MPAATTVPERLSFAEADTRVDGVLSASFEGAYDTVLFFDGHVTLDGNFLPAVAAMHRGMPTNDRRWPPVKPVGRAYRPTGIDLIVVTGDLTVAGDIELDESRPGLYVAGTTRAETLVGGDAEIYIGDGAFTYLVYGYYNHGILETGTVATPWVINSGHDLRVKAPDAYHIDNHGDDADSDFSRSNIGAAFVSPVVDAEDATIIVSAFLERLRAGLPVLRPDVTAAAPSHRGDLPA